ncbi:NAD(+) diphosphatase, partial [Proteus mirabilis]|nr:NAD(+) diphosphatase [Proteus mirabilis]
MELALTGNENGWWIVSHESKLWLPNGELPSGTAATLGLQGRMARTIGE